MTKSNMPLCALHRLPGRTVESAKNEVGRYKRRENPTQDSRELELCTIMLPTHQGQLPRWALKGAARGQTALFFDSRGHGDEEIYKGGSVFVFGFREGRRIQ